MGLLDSHPEKYLPRDSGGDLKVTVPGATTTAHSSLRTIDFTHSQIDEGLAWVGTHIDTSVGATGVSVLIATPTVATVIYNMMVGVETNNTCTWTFSKLANASGGTAITGECTNQSLDTADPLTLTHTATYVSSGTILTNHIIGSATGGGPFESPAGGTHISVDSWIMAADTEYLVYVTPVSNETVIINLFYHME